MKLDDTAFKKWQDWCSKIKKDLGNIIDNRAMFRRFEELVIENREWIDAHEGADFCYLVREWHAAQAVLGIRRHLKSSNDSISLVRLLEQIRDCSTQFTYDFYLGQHPIDPNYFEWQRGTFDRFSSDGKIVNRDIIQSDLDKLHALTGDIESLVDRVLAHLDKRGHDGSPVTYDDVNRAIDAFNITVCHYLSLITAEGFSTLEASVLFNWTEIFYHPLVDPYKHAETKCHEGGSFYSVFQYLGNDEWEPVGKALDEMERALQSQIDAGEADHASIQAMKQELWDICHQRMTSHLPTLERHGRGILDTLRHLHDVHSDSSALHAALEALRRIKLGSPDQ